jgi:6-phosphofructokinase 1
MIATYAGIGGGAESIVVPERPGSVGPVLNSIERGIRRGKRSSIIVVAEGQSGGGNAERIARELKRRGHSPRVCILGHIQRGGTPTARDRTLASAMGAGAVDYLVQGKSCGMAGVSGKSMSLVPFSKVLGKRKELPARILELIDALST